MKSNKKIKKLKNPVAWLDEAKKCFKHVGLIKTLIKFKN